MRSRLSMIAGLAVALAMAACATSNKPITPAGAEYYPAGGGTEYVATTVANTPYVTDVEGTVARIDAPANVIVLDNGQMYQMTNTSSIVDVNGQPVALSTLQPGTRVRLHGWQPVTYQNGQYVIAQNPNGTATTVAAAPGATVTTVLGSAAPTAPGTTTVYTAAPSSGTVVRVDPTQRVVVFDDGRMWRTAGDEMVLVDNKQVRLDTIQPGQVVTVQNGYPVALENGQYVQLAPGASTVVNANPMRQTISGRVTSVRGDEIKVKGDDGNSYKFPVPSTAGIKKGDLVQMDVSVNPVSPFALPR